MNVHPPQPGAAPLQADDSAIALVVDLDGTLSRTDTLHEALLGQISAAPLRALALPGLVARGRAVFKAVVADRGIVDPAHLVLNEAVLDAVRAAREAGRRTALVSASNHRQVAAVAEAVGLFDEVHGSEGGANLKGGAKAAFLTERFGEKGFDYIGDAAADVPVWRAARRAITVRADAALRRAA